MKKPPLPFLLPAIALAGLSCSLGLGFAAQGPDPSTVLRVRCLSPSTDTPRYELIEFEVQLSRSFANPYDPAQVDLRLELKTPSGRLIAVPAFYWQGFDYRLLPGGNRRAEWLYPTNQPQWRIRFAPEELGPYSGQVVLQSAGGLVQSEPIAFRSVPGPSKGFLRVSQKDPRFLESSDGTPFFPLGHNVAFIGSSQYLNTDRGGEVFRRMGENGANFARVWACSEDWAMAIEARKSAWGRSWDWNPPFSAIPGGDGYHFGGTALRLGGSGPAVVTASPSEPVALKPGTAYRLSGQLMARAGGKLIVEWNGKPLGEPVAGKNGQWSPFERSFTTADNQMWLGDLKFRSAGEGQLWLRQLSLRDAPLGPELLWEADPDRPSRGVLNQPDCFMVDRLLQFAQQHGIYLQLTLLTRDHYRAWLKNPAAPEYAQVIQDARRLLRYAVARWGYSTHIAAWEYFNEMDPGAPTDRFYRELGQYFEQIDPWRHLRTTSGWGPTPKDWVLAQLDVAQAHHYLRPVSGEIWRDEVASVLDRTKVLRDVAPGRPALLAEFGLADDKWGKSPYMDQDKQGVHFHNSLWASSFSGLSGAAAFWWWESLDQLNAYPHYAPLSKFLRDVPFTTASLKAVTLNTARKSRVLAWSGANCAYAWIWNPQANWWNAVVEKKTPEQVSDDSLALSGLAPGAYQVQWWDTYTGKILNQEQVRAGGGDLLLKVPPYSRDLACKLLPRPAE